MLNVQTALSVLTLSSLAVAQAPQLNISLGIRETGSTAAIGDPGGVSGSIEWINKDGPVLVLDGTWQQFSFRLDPMDPMADPVSAFTGDGAVTGDAGIIEHIRVLNFEGITDEMTLWIDDVTNTVNSVDTVFGTFEGYADGDEVMFQEPSFSGSTGGFMDTSYSFSGVDNYTASRMAPGSQQIGMKFANATTTNWCRLTTFRASLGLLQADPTIRFDQGSIVSFWMRGTTKLQPNLGSQGPGTAVAELVGTGLDAGESCVYYVSGAPSNGSGVLAVSVNGGTDVPVFGGNLVSFSNFVYAKTLKADVNGNAMFTIAGIGEAGDAVLQSVYLDPSLMGDPPIAFANAVNALIGPTTPAP